MFEIAVINEPSVFEPMRFDCIYFTTDPTSENLCSKNLLICNDVVNINL